MTTTAFDPAQMGLAQAYAGSLLELAQQAGEAEAIQEELADLTALLDAAPDFERFLVSPLVDEDDRRQALERIFRGRASDLLVDAMQVMNRKRRLGLVRVLAEAYRLAHQAARGQIDVQVATAIPLPAALRERVRQVAARVSGGEPQLIERVARGLIGGMVVQIGDRKIDGSIARQLRRLRERLLERASLEIQSGRGAELAAE